MSNSFFKNKGPFKISEIIQFLNLRPGVIDKDIEIKDIKDLLTSGPEDITFFHSKKYSNAASITKASFCITTNSLKHFYQQLVLQS